MQVRQATVADAAQISELIRSLSDPFFLVPDGEGAELFLQSISEAAVYGYVTAENFRYQVAESEGRLVGVVAVRDNSHLYHLFVTPAFQGQGISRQLWQLAKAQALSAGNPGRFTVNSSLRAVPVYERFGFVASGPTVTKHGMSFQPMVLVENGGQPVLWGLPLKRQKLTNRVAVWETPAAVGFPVQPSVFAPGTVTPPAAASDSAR